NSTITNNSTGTGGSGGGIIRSAGTVTVKSSIIAGNSASPGPDVFGSFTSQGFNLVGKSDNSTGFTDATDQKGTVASALDAQLLALADNGGPTQTHSLQCTSPAIDKGKNFVLDINNNPLPDQRGLARPFDLSDSVYPNANGGDGSDIGAVELHSGSGCIPAAVSPNPQPSTNEDTAVTITLKGTYSQSSPALTFTVTQQPAHGALSNPSAVNCTFANSTNTCTQTIKYTPASNFNGLDSFKFKASTAALDSDEADVNITVGAVNDPPVAIPQSVATDEDTPLPVTLTGTDVDSTTLTFQIVAGPSHGSLSGTAPNVTYTPAANYNGPDSFTFKANDGQADSNIAKVSITVNAVNDPPVAADETYNTSENTPLSVAVASGVLKNDTDIDSVGLTAQVVAAPTHSASFTLNADGSFAYTPASNFVGTDTFTYKANDGSASNNLSNTATVTIKVGAGGTLQFNSATYSVTENAGTVTVTVTRTGSSNGAASIHYATVAGGTATGAAACAAGVDFVNTSGTLNWADGDAADKTFTVTICDDSLFEQDETVNLALSNVAGSAELGAQAAAVLTIHDDDSKGGVFGFSQPTYTVGESAGFVTITVTRTGDTTRASAVDYATDDGSDPHVFVPCDSTTGIALERCDYTAAFGTLQFAAGETSKTFVVLISDDSYAEGNEVTTLKLSNPTNG
ncbi:MAG TPA: Ig-like domain-containing protein, partial [Mycobacteriales bacterium]|nr:Ig-like domain-containing protein [Mycobacteriales bacterium]